MFTRKVTDRSLRLASRIALPGFIAVLVGAVCATPVEARRHHHHAHVAYHAHIRFHARHGGRRVAQIFSTAAGAGGTAAIVVDGPTGHVIYGMNEDALRHPASVTKVMTLYLLFEQLEKGRLTLDDEIQISAHAAAQAPSKLGLRPGQSIRVEDAIKAVVTKSANDIAVAIAEAVGGTESEFAELMTQKAHALGMNHTLYRNASGLPNNEQITTASDLAVLGRSIQARFPRYYHYFSMHEFAYHGQRIHNHNHLMDRVEGMDGIKTGYTAASGFNLLSSVKRDGHYIVAVVMGGKSAHSRDNYMEALIDRHIEEAGAPRAGVRVADSAEPAPASNWWGGVLEPRPVSVRTENEPKIVEAPKDVQRDPPRLQVAAVVAEPRPRPAYVSAAEKASRETDDDDESTTAAVRQHHVASDGSTAAHAHGAGSAVTPGPAHAQESRFQEARAKEARAKEPNLTAHVEPPVRPEFGVSVAARQTAGGKPQVTGWSIQIGATDDADKAAALLSKAKTQRAALLASARAYTEMVHKGNGTLYRARFAGLEESKAEAACKALKNSGFNCFTTRN